MSREQIKQAIYDVLTDHWCPEQLAAEAATILSRHYPDASLLKATEEQISLVRKAKEYVVGGENE
ncbi:hypothetical protein NIES2100_14590 [Calothrix sp. NIES-2100]|uniref:hypothetical protein n=1 Tax=Calothrix sp. NIES-2100 TaxID=1954172 RepID=UPI000B5E37F1|nr:hypothetical protein NIES2100_14590 [Calothrix sp. NIES-2100]